MSEDFNKSDDVLTNKPIVYVGHMDKYNGDVEKYIQNRIDYHHPELSLQELKTMNNGSELIIIMIFGDDKNVETEIYKQLLENNISMRKDIAGLQKELAQLNSLVSDIRQWM